METSGCLTTSEWSKSITERNELIEKCEKLIFVSHCVKEKFFDGLDRKNHNTFFEREPIERVTKKRQLMAFRHTGFWKCLDTKRDRDELEVLFLKDASWLQKWIHD